MVILAGLATSGCTKTSDGSIEPVALAMPTVSMEPIRKMWRKPKPEPVIQTSLFPRTPTEPEVKEPPRTNKARRKVRRSGPRIPRLNTTIAPPFKPDTSPDAKNLTCKNVTAASGRVRVVCD